MPQHLSLTNAREHNLKGVDLKIPHDALVVFTGPSGSGKSSLAFDTIYREAERRYLDSFSGHARRLLARLGRPQVDRIDGLRPALALQQRRFRAGSRSTVGTLSDLWAPLRLLFARFGTAHCPSCAAELKSVSPERLREIVQERYGDSPFQLLAPLIDGHKGAHRSELKRLQRAGCEQVYVDGELLLSSPTPELENAKRHSVAGVIANFPGPVESSELQLAIERGLALAADVLWVLCDKQLERFSTKLACEHCSSPVPSVGPRLFSFNSSYGACTECKGIGLEDVVDPALLVADGSLSLRAGALVPTTPSGYIVYSQVTIDVLDSICKLHGFSVDQPWDELSAEQQDVIMRGSKRLKVPFGKHPLESRLKWKGITARPRENEYYPGLIPTIEETLKRNRNANILRFARSATCSACAGSRLSKAALAVLLGGKSIAYFATLQLSELIGQLEQALEGQGKIVLQSMRESVAPLLELGLGYISLERPAASLSSGEAQRLRLAAQIGAPLAGMLYVLDEPSTGLHATDRERLYGLLAKLRDGGSSVLIVEHDPISMLRADWLVELGPGAGEAGGEVLFSGPPADWVQAPGSNSIPFDSSALDLTQCQQIVLKGASARNLQGLDVSFPLRAMTLVSGVSGAGKSSLVNHTLAPALRARLSKVTLREVAGEFQALEGAESIDALVQVNASPIGRTPRSNPATYTGLFDALRDLFARLPKSKELGLTKSHFSFNTKGGRCEVCEGAGHISIGMHGLAPHLETCSACAGKRFQSKVLEARWQGLSVLDVLESSVEEARQLFAEVPKLKRQLDALFDLGLGYLRLGQPAPTLSGGEAQRVKLARELSRPQKGHAFYLFDEPASGLGLGEVTLLLRALRKLVDAGHTLVIIEHNTALLAQADHLIDLGPGSGKLGGRVVCSGTPSQVAACTHSATGRALAKLLQSTSKKAMPIARAAPPGSNSSIEVRAATTHNLKRVDLDVRAHELTVITGVSGSGKSSLALHTLHAEAQRRFLSGLSSHARRQLSILSPGQTESISGLTPSLALGQGAHRYGSRSTVGTLTELLDDLRLLYSRCSDQGGLSARAFSFNHGEGACPACEGAGRALLCDPLKLVSDPTRSLMDGAIDGSKAGKFYGERGGQHLAILAAVGRELGFDYEQSFDQLSAEAMQLAMYGSGERQWDVQWNFERKDRKGEHHWQTVWLGFCGYVDEEYGRKRQDARGKQMLGLLSESLCQVCSGERLAQAARQALFAGQRLPELCAMAASELGIWLKNCDPGRELAERSRTLRSRLIERLAKLKQLGLGYLPLARRAAELSGGEAQRVRLAGRLVSQLSGLTYVFDEPTLGLHASDIPQLMECLEQLLADGNRVLLVEHDPQVIQRAERVIEMGPGAGRLGGQIIAQGTPQEIAAGSSPTGLALSARPELGEGRKALGQLKVQGASLHNLKQLDVSIPTGGIVAISGVSGSGKSTLIFDVLGASMLAGKPVGCASIVGSAAFEQTLLLDQSPLSRQPGVTPLSHLGLLPALAKIYARGEDARVRKLSPKHFSPNARGGRCEACRGLGRISEDMDFLGERWLTCAECQGKRYGAQVQACLHEGWSLPALLDLDIHTARQILKAENTLNAGLGLLEEVGLGYLQLGQAADMLSGGEAQRLRLAAELWSGGKPSQGQRLYLLDEPTSGLHPSDVNQLFKLFRRLSDAGHSLLIVEHDLSLIARADHVIDMGPGAGSLGGQVIFGGSPAELGRHKTSLTAVALRDQLRLGATPTST